MLCMEGESGGGSFSIDKLHSSSDFEQQLGGVE